VNRGPDVLPLVSHFEWTPCLRRLCIPTCTHPQNRKYITYRKFTIPPENDQATATSNVHGKFGEVWIDVVLEICEMRSRETDRHGETVVAILRSPTGGGVIDALRR